MEGNDDPLLPLFSSSPQDHHGCNEPFTPEENIVFVLENELHDTHLLNYQNG